LVAAALLSLSVLSTGIALGAQHETETSQREMPLDVRGVELVDKRTATSKTFQLPDGARETQVFTSPINYRDAEGKWQTIGASLEEAGEEAGADETAFTNGENSVDVSLPERLGNDPVRISTGEDWVETELIGAGTEDGNVEAGVVSYESSDGSTTFELSGLADGLKENIELGDASQPSTFTYDLSVSAGLVPHPVDDGSIEFRDDEGEVVFLLPAPTMYDSSGMAPASAIRYELEDQAEGQWRLRVVADREWLEQPGRDWPVTIDPTLTVEQPSLDCVILTGSPTSNLCGSKGWTAIGASAEYGTPDQHARSLLKFDLSSIPSSAYVSDATIKLYAPTEAKNTVGVQLRRATRPWTSAVSWTKYDGTNAWSAEGGDSSTPTTELYTVNNGGKPGWWEFPAKQLTRKWVDGTYPNQGVVLKLMDDYVRECEGSLCPKRIAEFASSAFVESSRRPKMVVTYYPAASTDSKVTSPANGTRAARRFKLQAKWNHQGVTGVYFQYKDPMKGWTDVPVSRVTDDANQTVSWPLPVEGGVRESEPVYWDAVEPVWPEYVLKGNIRAVLVGAPGADGYTEPVEVELNRQIGGTKDATAPVGPGTVNLLTGNFTVSRTDVSIPGFGSALEFTRTHSSRDAASGAKSVLGPGWKPGAAVEAAGGAEWRSVRLETATVEEEDEEGNVEVIPIGEYALVIDNEGYEYAFEKDASGAFVSPAEAAGWVLKMEGGNFVLSDPDGNSTTFSKGTAGPDYLPIAVTQTGGAANTTQMVYEIIGGNRRLKMIIAPTASGVTCNESNAKTGEGCRSLIFAYTAATSWGAPAELGDRLSTITYYGPTGPTTISHWIVSRYNYDPQGRLIEAWDPRYSPDLIEKYAYEASGRLQTITPPGEEPWTLEYGTFEEVSVDGRLVAVKRPSLVASPAVAQTTISYGVPLSGSGAPYDMSGAAVKQWGQQDLPTDATAIFPPDQVPSNPPGSYSRATVFYLDVEGQQVNVATPSGAGTSAPSITTSETDEFGNVVRELSAQNRLRALAVGSGESVARSHELETKRIFTADGTEMQEEWGPLHQVLLESGEAVKARMHTTIQYEDAKNGWPGTGPDPHLPTRETTGASIPKQGTDADVRVTETKYDWKLRQPTETISDALGMKLTTRVAYDEVSGLPIERSLPAKPGGGDAHTTKIIYYSAGSSPDSACANNKGWASLPCKVMPAAQPGTEGQPELLITHYASYNQLGQPTEAIESPGGKEGSTRKTITVYDNVGRVKTTRQEGGGTPIPKQETLYWSTTGRLKTQRFVCEAANCTGFDNQAITTTYDTLGRVISYLDADKKTSTATYDLLGRPLVTNDAKGTQTRSYDATSGLLIGLEDSAAGTFTASYDADGNLVEQGLPNGLVAKTTYDEAGQPVGLSYDKMSYCSEKCTWLAFGAERSIYGQVLSQASTLSSQQYSYDKVGRLTLVRDTPQGGECTTRSYAYDADSNRTALVTRKPGAGGVCDTSSAGNNQTYSYDAADRLIGSEIAYDNFGRITSLPGAYAGGGTLSTTYYANDLVATQSQGGITNSYNLDSALRPRERVQTGGSGGTEVFHYAGGSDSPSWTAKGTAWTRNIAGIAGELAAIQDSATGTSLQLANLHGDIVATASLSQTATKPTATFEFDEFGNPKQTGSPRFGWLGGKLRRTELPSGVIQMGVRSYVPTLGRFISSDPVPGGSANAYDYADADPVNGSDHLGTCSSRRCQVVRNRERTRLAKLFDRTKHRILVINGKTQDNVPAGMQRAREVVKAAFKVANPIFKQHPLWKKECKSSYRKYLSTHVDYESVAKYEFALDQCASAVSRIWNREVKREEPYF
jgi:RHS repeat-associated protein